MLWTWEIQGAVTVMWVSPRFGHPHSKNPSDIGIPCNPNPPQIANVMWEGDAHITRVLEMRMPKTWGCPYHCNSAQYSPYYPHEYVTLPDIKRADVTIPPATQAKLYHPVLRYLVFSFHFADYVYQIEHCVPCLIFHPNPKIFSLRFKVNFNFLCN